VNTTRKHRTRRGRNHTERGQPCPQDFGVERKRADKAVRAPNRFSRTCSVLIDCGALAAVIVLLCPAAVVAQLTVETEGGPEACFGGRSNTVAVRFHNPGAATAETDVKIQLFQANSATRVALGERMNWKHLQVLPRQTVLELAEVGLPAVKAETPFLLTWLDDTGRKLGESNLAVYPTNLLDLLTNLAGGKPIGVYDVSLQVQRAFQRSNVAFEDFQETGFAGFAGRLAVVAGAADDPENLPARVQTLASDGVAVVWIQAPLPRRPELEPALSSVPFGRGAIATMPSRTVAALGETPLAQINLLQAAKMSLSSARGLLYREKP